MTELRCATCGKIVAYIAVGSRLSNGMIALCYKCKRPNESHSHGVPEFMRGFFGNDRP